MVAPDAPDQERQGQRVHVVEWRRDQDAVLPQVVLRHARAHHPEVARMREHHAPSDGRLSRTCTAAGPPRPGEGRSGRMGPDRARARSRPQPRHRSRRRADPAANLWEAARAAAHRRRRGARRNRPARSGSWPRGTCGSRASGRSRRASPRAGARQTRAGWPTGSRCARPAAGRRAAARGRRRRPSRRGLRGKDLRLGAGRSPMIMGASGSPARSTRAPRLVTGRIGRSCSAA